MSPKHKTSEVDINAAYIKSASMSESIVEQCLVFTVFVMFVLFFPANIRVGTVIFTCMYRSSTRNEMGQWTLEL